MSGVTGKFRNTSFFCTNFCCKFFLIKLLENENLFILEIFVKIFYFKWLRGVTMVIFILATWIIAKLSYTFLSLIKSYIHQYNYMINKNNTLTFALHPQQFKNKFILLFNSFKVKKMFYFKNYFSNSNKIYH